MARTPNATKAEPAGVKAVKAKVKIDGTILPDTIFVPASQEQRDELFALEAVAELEPAEAALHAQMATAVATSDTDDVIA